jgi:hypothetical protein
MLHTKLNKFCLLQAKLISFDAIKSIFAHSGTATTKLSAEIIYADCFWHEL